MKTEQSSGQGGGPGAAGKSGSASEAAGSEDSGGKVEETAREGSGWIDDRAKPLYTRALSPEEGAKLGVKVDALLASLVPRQLQRRVLFEPAGVGNSSKA